MAAAQAANQPNGQPADSNAEDTLDTRARKRMEVGLSPRRPTAKAAPVRPPDVQSLPMPPAALALLLLGVLVVTIGLLAMNLTGWAPAWWPARAEMGGEVSAVTAPTAMITLPPLDTARYTLEVSEDFSAETPLLLQGEQPEEWRTELLPAESAYRIQAWPNHLAWSLIGLDSLEGHRLQTDALVSRETPEGYAGLVVRFVDERDFYLFAVDGQGRYMVQQQVGDEAAMLQPWSAAPFLNTAGSSNVLTVEDTGEVLRFFGNGMLLHELSYPAQGPGFVGLVGGSLGPDVADLRFDWLQLYRAVTDVAATP